jgi:hypothetical protein
MRWLIGCALFVLLALSGCSHTTSAEASSGGGDKHAYDSFTKQFGQALVSKNYAAAYAMTSPEFQKAHSQQAFQTEFEKAKSELAPTVDLVAVNTDTGDLPGTDDEATRVYLFPPDIIARKKDWKGWNIARLSGKEDRGMDAFFLVLDGGSGPKVGFVYYDRG